MVSAAKTKLLPSRKAIIGKDRLRLFLGQPPHTLEGALPLTDTLIDVGGANGKRQTDSLKQLFTTRRSRGENQRQRRVY